MKILALGFVAALVSACAVGASHKAASCKGEWRPANPFGSVLDDVARNVDQSMLAPAEVEKSTALRGSSSSPSATCGEPRR